VTDHVVPEGLLILRFHLQISLRKFCIYTLFLVKVLIYRKYFIS